MLLKIKIKAEGKTYTEEHLLNDDYVIAKNSEKLQKLVQKAIDSSRIEAVEDVITTVKIEW